MTKGPPMLRPLPLALCLILTVTGCARIAESRFNPLNWFGRSTAVAAQPDGTIRPLIPSARTTVVVDNRMLVSVITSMAIERTVSGAIIRASGITPTQGYFNAQLVPVAQESGVLVYEFRVEAPAGFEAVGSEASRTITVARVLSADELAGVQAVRVQGAQNGREARR